MDMQSVHRLLEMRQKAQWTTAVPGVPLIFTNTKQEIPTDKNFVKCSINFGRSNKAELSKGMYRQVGILTVQAFALLGKNGERAALSLADAAAAIWRGAQVSPVIFQAPEVVTIGDNGEGWYQVNVINPFYWDAVYS